MEPKRIVIIGGTDYIWDRARKLGLEIIWIDKPQNFQIQALQFISKAVLTDYETDPSLCSIVRAIHEQTPIVSCVSFTERGVYVAALLNQRLGLQGVRPDLVRLVNNKIEMRRILDRYDAYRISHGEVHTRDDLVKFASSNGYPFIVKPHNGVGSQNVYKVQSSEDLACIPETFERYIVEEYLSGPEFSVEAFSISGKHVVLSITKKTTMQTDSNAFFVEQSHAVPASITTKAWGTVTKYVTDFLDILGITDGPTHTEVIITKYGPKIVETHLRPAGDHIPELVQLSTGYDLYTLTMKLFSGEQPAIQKPVVHKGAAAILYFSPPPGRLKSVLGFSIAKAIRGIVSIRIDVSVGETISAIRSSKDRIGYVMAIGDSLATVESICASAAQQVEFVMYD